MPDKKVLKGIKPFNKFEFRSCYYHQLIAAFARYGVDEKIWLINYLPVYELDKETAKLSMREKEILTDTEFEELSGIRLVKKKGSTNIVSEVISAIDRGMPVIVGIDCFYLDYREDTYKKYHHNHFVLVYGYDKSKKVFTVNDHLYLNSMTYVEREAGFGVIEKCFEEYRKNMEKPDGFGLIKIKKTAAPRVIDSGLYRNRLRGFHQDIEAGLIRLREFGDLFFAVIADEKMLKDYVKTFYEFFGFIRWKKEIQRYQLLFLFENEEINALIDKIIQSSIFLYGLLVKMHMAGAYPEKSMEKIADKMRCFLDAERKLHEFLGSGAAE
jgi:hypothetical protein